MKKVVLITNIPNPYRVPLFNELSEQLKQSDITLKIIFGAAGYERRLFQLDESEMHFEFRILNDKGHTFSRDGEKTVFLYRGLKKALVEENPDLVIVSGFSSATMKVFFGKLFRGTPFIIWNGSIAKEGSQINPVRRIQRWILCKYSNAFVAYGNKAADYLKQLGAKPENVFVATNTVDTEFFEKETNTIRIQNGSDPKRVTTFLVLGYLVPRKRIEDLLECVRLLSMKRRDFKVEILGDGISKEILMKYVQNNSLEELVSFHGFVQKQELPSWLAKSSALLFQTGYDIWGLVVNESMAAGVPVLSSPNAGATYDLIRDGVNGFVVNYKNHNQAIEKMEWVIDHPAEAREMGLKASEFVRTHASVRNAAAGFLKAIKKVL